MPEIGAPHNLKTSLDANEPQMGARRASIIPEQGLELRAVIQNLSMNHLSVDNLHLNLKADEKEQTANPLLIQDCYDGEPSRFKQPVSWRQKLPKHLLKSMSVLKVSNE